MGNFLFVIALTAALAHPSELPDCKKPRMHCKHACGRKIVWPYIYWICTAEGCYRQDSHGQYQEIPDEESDCSNLKSLLCWDPVKTQVYPAKNGFCSPVVDSSMVTGNEEKK